MIFLSFLAVLFSAVNYRTAKKAFVATKNVPEFGGSAQEVTLLILTVLFLLAFVSLLLPRSLSGFSTAFTALPFRYSFYALSEGNITKYNPALSLLFGALLLAGALVSFFGYARDGALRPSWKIKRCVIPSFALCALAALLQLIKLKMSVAEEQLPLFFSAYNVIVIAAMVPAVTALVLGICGKGRDKYLGVRQLVASALASVLPAALLAVNIAAG